MNTLIIVSAILFYAVCGVAAYGLTFWYFQDTWPLLADKGREDDARFALKMAGLGPFSLIAILIHVPKGRRAMGIKPAFHYCLRFSAK